MLDAISQIMIMLCGASAVYLTGSQKASVRLWAGIVGIIGEPFWVYTTYVNFQWGILAMTVIYLFAWVRVIKNNLALIKAEAAA